MDTCYTNLANAVIIQAAKDYKKALRRLKKFPRDKEPYTPNKIVSDFSVPVGLKG